MKTFQRILIGAQIVTFSLGLVTLGSGCGGSTDSTTGGMSVQDQVKQTENAKSAMDAASKSQKVPKK